MSNFFSLQLDTLGPQGPSLGFQGGITVTADQLVNLVIGCSDATTTGYQMKIWGSVDAAYDVNIKATEATSVWATYSTTKQIKLATGNGSKTIYLKIRDNVYNESAQVSASITLDTSAPVVTITMGPDATVISTVAGRDTANFSFTSTKSFNEYKVKVVAASNATEGTGTVIPISAGSINMTGTGSFAAATAINCSIKGTDLKTASNPDGVKVIKIFVKDAATNVWST